MSNDNNDELQSIITCPVCSKEFPINTIGLHGKKVHKIEKKEFYKLIYELDEDPKCACGCGEITRFQSIPTGFCEYKQGHKARIDNPHKYRTEETFEKLANTRKTLFAEGKLKSWCEGLSKETDERIRLLAEKGRASILSNPNEITRRSSQMKQNRLNGTIPTLTGEDHSQWKGGSSPVSARCHGSRQLYQGWKYPKLVAAGFKCQRCGNTEKLEVHHPQETMASIIHKMIEEHNPEKKKDFELETKIVDAVVQYHLDNDVIGEVICFRCHEEEHPHYNYHK